jgi:hypothetical protein
MRYAPFSCPPHHEAGIRTSPDDHEEKQPRVGRLCEFARLWSLLEESLTGRLHVALVAGESGMGKTRLPQVVARWVEGIGTLMPDGLRESDVMCICCRGAVPQSLMS